MGLALVGCDRPVPHERSPSSGSAPQVESQAPPGGNHAPSPVPPGSASAAADAALEWALASRRVFQQIQVGELGVARRYTWALFDGKSRARVQLFCQVLADPRLDHPTLRDDVDDDAQWHVKVFQEYMGIRVTGPNPSYAFASESAFVASQVCPAPIGFRLECRAAGVAVHHAGAKLTPGRPTDAGANGPGVWVPGDRADVAGLRCDLVSEPGSKPFDEWSAPASPLFFTDPSDESAGVEWVFENSDAVLQDGGYRWMPPRR